MSYQDVADVGILDAAERLLATEPVGHFTMAQLAEESRLSRATLYRRVGSKEALLQHLVRERGVKVKAADGADIPARILRAARIAFGKNGLTRTTMEEIAAEAGLGVATLYRHFGDRESLIRAFMHHYAPQRAFERVAQQSHGDIEADLTHLVTEMLTFLHENRDMIWLGLVEGDKTERLLARLREAPKGTRVDIVRFFENAVATAQLRGEDPEQLTTALAGMLMAFALQVPVLSGSALEDPRQTAEFIARLFLHGMGVHGEIGEGTS